MRPPRRTAWNAVTAPDPTTLSGAVVRRRDRRRDDRRDRVLLMEEREGRVGERADRHDGRHAQVTTERARHVGTRRPAPCATASPARRPPSPPRWRCPRPRRATRRTARSGRARRPRRARWRNRGAVRTPRCRTGRRSRGATGTRPPRPGPRRAGARALGRASGTGARRSARRCRDARRHPDRTRGRTPRCGVRSRGLMRWNSARRSRRRGGSTSSPAISVDLAVGLEQLGDPGAELATHARDQQSHPLNPVRASGSGTR